MLSSALRRKTNSDHHFIESMELMHRTLPSMLQGRFASTVSRFANVPFTNVLWCSAKKRNECCACIICFILLAMIQKSAIHMYVPRSFSH